eukprot:12843306-Ditylum_brightwellii.AAC.1
MGHPQPPTPVMNDNSTACGIINNAVKQQCTCTIDMHFYWVHDHCAQKHFIVYWAPGKYNMVNYHTKHHTSAHHQRICPTYLHVEKLVAYVTELNCPSGLQGCVETDGAQTTWAQYLCDVTNGDGISRDDVTHDDGSNAKLSSIDISVVNS